MSDAPRDPSLEHVLGAFAEGALYGVRVGLPGKITAYDADKQFASVQPLIQDRELADDDEYIPKTIPEIHTCPVLFLGNARGRVTFPVAVGDLCYIMFASSSISRWFKKGGSSPVDPGDDRRHDINDAIVLVGMHTQGSVPTTAPTDALVLHAGAGTKVKVGGPSGTEPTLMATSFLDALDTLVQAIATAVGGINTLGAGTAAGTAITGAFNSFSAALLRSAYTTDKTEVK